MSARFISVSTAIAAFCSLAVAPPAGAQVTIERLMSSPFPSELVAAHNHAKVAWVQNAEGVRNIWVAEGPAYTGRQITSYSDDDGQEVTNLNWTPDGEQVLFVYGGASNRQGETPNPTSNPDGATQSLWLVSADGGEPRKLADGAAPSLSPGGDRVAFLRGGQIWSIRLDGDGEEKQLLRIRGRAGSLRWSPDGSMLAFVSSRGDHSFIGVYDLAANSVHYLDPSVDRDGNPVWSPDSRRIAFTRQPNDRDLLPFMPRRSAQPWSVRVADAGTGVAREVWIADAGAGSAFHAIVADNQLLWGAGGNLVFPWEKDGWVHLYAVGADGGGATLLTPGEFEVEHVGLTPDRREVLFSSNQDDIDRRHLWRVPVAGGRATRITTGSGIEWSPQVTSDGAVAFLASDARRPAHAEIMTPSTERKSLAPETLVGFPESALVEPQQVIFSGADGMRVHGQLFLPPNPNSGEKHPAVVFFHGGSRRQMLLGWHYRGYYHNAYAFNQYLATRGYVVLSVNYRSGIGYGMEFREALNYGARGASEFNDVTGAGLYLQSRADVDAARIGLWGGSYGGYLTALGLARASDLFAAGVDLHGVHDWNVVIRNFASGYDPTARAEHARLAFESSPMASIEDWRSPVLLIHGDDDRNVPFSESVDLAESLRDNGVEFEQLIFPDEVHGFLLHRNWLAAYRAAADFFDKHLLNRMVEVSGR